jgi:hypothetical protein
MCLFIFQPVVVEAEVVCKSQVKYSWKKEGAEEASAVVFAILESRNEEEGLAKAKVEAQALRNATRARQHCISQHENFSGCIAAKFESQSGVLERLGFASRKKLEEAIATDCKARLGSCLGVEPTEVVCETLEAEGEQEVGSKDKKKGKDKKK